METAGEGGAWGIALLAAFMQEKNGRTLDQYLAEAVFQDSEISVLNPEEEGVAGYRSFMERLYEGAFDRTRSSGKHVNEEHNQVPGIVKENKYIYQIFLFLIQFYDWEKSTGETDE